MNKLLLALLFFNVTINLISQNKIERTNLEFELPNKKWTFSEEKRSGDKVIHVYKRLPIGDSQLQKGVPNISIITESRQGMNVVTYFANKRTEIALEVEAVFMLEDLKMKYDTGICYLGTYSDTLGSRKRYVTFLNNKKIGVMVICDVDEELFKQVDKEFLRMLSSIEQI